MAELIAAVQGPGGRTPSAVECSHMSAAVVADLHEVRRRADAHADLRYITLRARLYDRPQR